MLKHSTTACTEAIEFSKTKKNRNNIKKNYLKT